MKAYIRQKYGNPEVIELLEFKKPTPTADQLLVKVKAAAVNPLDWRVMRGTPLPLRFMTGLFKPKNPFIGSDASGVVEEVGSGVKDFKPGDEVYGEIYPSGAGAFAEYVCVRTDFWAKKPNNLSHQEAAAVPVAGLTALQGLYKYGKLKQGQKLLLNGASGGVGTFALQIAKAACAHVTAICSTGKVAQSESLGADKVIDYTQTDYTQLTDKYDLIFDGVGNCQPKVAKHLLKKGGTCLLTGWGGFSHMMNHSIANLFTGKNSNLISFNATTNVNDLNQLTDLIESGKVKPVIDRVYNFDQLPDAIAYQEDGHASGKVIIEI